MTYSEVREMYTRDMAMIDEERDHMRRVVRDTMDLISSWILPWSITILLVLFSTSLLNAQKSLAAVALLLLALPFERMRRSEEGLIRLLSIALSYLVTVSVLLTVLPVWG